MTVTWKKWCPKGCGKRVIYVGGEGGKRTGKSLYKCEICNKIFTKEELRGLNTIR
jgi:transposase-like protein